MRQDRSLRSRLRSDTTGRKRSEPRPKGAVLPDSIQFCGNDNGAASNQGRLGLWLRAACVRLASQNSQVAHQMRYS
jgi:hypothetical protein